MRRSQFPLSLSQASVSGPPGAGAGAACSTARSLARSFRAGGAAQAAVDATQVGVNAALGAGDLALRARQHNRGQITYTDPAAAVAGGSGYAVALPDAPGVATRGSITLDQFQEYMRQAHATSSEAVREAYIRGGMAAMGQHGAQPQAARADDPSEVQDLSATVFRP